MLRFFSSLLGSLLLLTCRSLPPGASDGSQLTGWAVTR